MHFSRWVGCVALLSACGGSAASAPPPEAAPTAVVAPPERSHPVHKRGGQKLIVEVGAAGGTLELDNGARLEIPAGALDSTVQITFSEGARTTAFSNREYERPLGPTIEIAPELELRQPVKVSIPALRFPEGFGPGDVALGLELLGAQRAVEMHGVQTRWDYFPATVQAGRAVAELPQVPGFRLQFIVSKSE
jgi:hypothetical protein